jgi:O-methyltransferase domain
VPGGADTYLFRHIVHDWTDDEQSVQILNSCRKVIPNNGRLLIIEAVVPTGNEPSLAKDFDMVMLVFPGGIERTKKNTGSSQSRRVPTQLYYTHGIGDKRCRSQTKIERRVMTNKRSDSFRYLPWLKGLVFWHRSLLDKFGEAMYVALNRALNGAMPDR